MHPEAYVLTVYNLVCDPPIVRFKTRLLPITKPNALELIRAVRARLPHEFGASLLDEQGRNVTVELS